MNADNTPAKKRINNPLKLGTSTALKSTSKYLNHPELRHWLYTESLRRNGPDYNQFNGILELGTIVDELIIEDEVNALFSEQRAKDPELDKWFKEGYLCTHDIPALADYADGTLGKEYYKTMAPRGLEHDFLEKFEPRHDYDYWKRRAIQTHDVEHIVTGCQIDPIGEFGLIVAKSMNVTTHMGADLAKHLNVFSSFLLSSALQRLSLHCPELIPTLFKAIGWAEKIGSQAKPFYMPKYEEMWDMPVVEVRQQLGIVIPQDMEDTSWTTAIFLSHEL